MSAMEFIQGTGMPVYRLHTQLRMAEGMFDMMAKLIYPEVPVKYGNSRSSASPSFAAGHALESFIQEKYPGQATPPPDGKLYPVFLDCPGSKVFTEPLTGSKRSKD